MLSNSFLISPEDTYLSIFEAKIDKKKFQEQNYKDLENLAATLMDAQETPEAWVAYAFLAKCQKRYDKALYFTEKVFFYFRREI